MAPVDPARAGVPDHGERRHLHPRRGTGSGRGAGGRRASDDAAPGSHRRPPGRGRGAARRDRARGGARSGLGAGPSARGRSRPGRAGSRDPRAYGARKHRGAGRAGPAHGGRGAGGRRPSGLGGLGAGGGAGDAVMAERGGADTILPRLAGGSTVTVGSFGGGHLGHQAVLREIAGRAEAAGRASVLVTFEPHPLEVVNPQAAPPLLTTGPERREVLAQTPLDYAYFLRFDRQVAGLSPEEFVRDVLLGRLGMRELVIGHDHGFGRGRSGDVETLRRLGGRYGFEVDVVPAVDVGEQHVSSSRIRRAVAGGDLPTAARMLGRPYQVSGVVGPGERRGRQIGVPTINLADVPPQKLLPPDGVYAVRVEWRGGRAGGMMNQGPKPTFADGRRTLEAHLFDFEGDLYGEWVRLEWVERLRDVERFPSVEALKEQLQRDRTRARAVLAGAGPDPSISHA